MSSALVGLAMFGLMFAMGLTLTGEDFRRIAQNPRPTVIGTTLQLIVLPLTGVAIAGAFALPPPLTVGLVVLAACPGGLFSNMYVHIARGNTALSITLTATATFVTLFTLPLWARFAVATAAGSAPGAAAEIQMPILETALQLGGLTILPILIGMLVRNRRPSLLSWERRISIVSVIVIIIGVTSDALKRPDPPAAEFALSLAPVACWAASTLLLGVLLPALFGLSARDTVTIAVELIVKNTLLGIVLLTQAVDFNAIVPILVFTVVQTPSGLLLLYGWRYLARHGYVEPAPPPAVET